MSDTIFNQDYLKESLAKQMNKEMMAAAEPLIKKALVEIEMVMRQKLGSMVIALLENQIAVDQFGEDLRILVKHQFK